MSCSINSRRDIHFNLMQQWYTLPRVLNMSNTICKFCSKLVASADLKLMRCKEVYFEKQSWRVLYLI